MLSPEIRLHRPIVVRLTGRNQAANGANSPSRRGPDTRSKLHGAEPVQHLLHFAPWRPPSSRSSGASPFERLLSEIGHRTHGRHSDRFLVVVAVLDCRLRSLNQVLQVQDGIPGIALVHGVSTGAPTLLRTHMWEITT